MRRANVEEGWREGAPARARVDGSTVVVDAAAMGRPRAFEDGRAWDHRDEARARGVYVPPSGDEAEARANEMQPRVLTEEGKLEKFRYFDDALDVALEFGAEVAGYFYVLRTFAALFFVAFALSLPTMYVNYTSTYYASRYEAEPEVAGYQAPTSSGGDRPQPSFHSWFVDWHWANPMSASLGTVAPDSAPQRVWVLAGASSGVLRWSTSKVDFIRFAVLMDVLTCTLLFMSVPVLWWTLHRMERRVEQGTATLKDYTVLVSGLPYDATEEEVRCHFALRYGEVARVAVIGTECTHINAQRRRRRLLEDYDEASAALIAAGNRGGDTTKTKIEKQIVNIDRKLKRRKARTRAKVSAFVTFEDERSKIACMLRNARSYFSYIFSFPKTDRFRGKFRFRVRYAPEPEDVMYENLGVKRRLWRRVVAAVVCAIFVTMCYGFLSLLVNDKEKRWQRVDMVVDKLAQDVGIVTSRGDPVEQFDVHKDQFKTACSAQLDQCGVLFSKDKLYIGLPWGAPLSAFYDYSNATARDRSYAQQDTVKDLKTCADDADRCPGGQHMQNCYACYCASLRFGLPSNVISAYNRPIRHACEPYISLGPGEYYNWLGTSFFITLLNLSVEFVAPLLVIVERVRMQSAKKAMKTKIIFVVRFLNVAVIYTLLNANFSRVGKYFPLIKQMFGLRGEYSDFTNEWYNDVGLVVFFTILMNAAMRFIGRVLSDVMSNLRRKIALAYIHTQKKLNDIFEGPDFDTGAKCGDMCFVVMASMTFVSGIPLLYLVLSMYFTISYLYDYRLLLRVCKTPTRTQATLPKTMTSVLFASVSIHSLVGLWMYSVHWTPNWLKPTATFEDSALHKINPLAQSIGGDRFNPPHDNGALLQVVANDGTATAYFHEYRQQTVGAVSPSELIPSPPLTPTRFAERPFSEAGAPLMVLAIVIVGLIMLAKLVFICMNIGQERKKIERSWKDLPKFHEAMATGLIVGSATYQPEDQPDYEVLFDTKAVRAANRGSGAHVDGTGPDRGDSVNSQEDFDYSDEANDERYVYDARDYDAARDYDGGGPWIRKTSSSLYAAGAETAKRGSRGTHQRDGGRYGGPVVDVRALGVENDYNHRRNDDFARGENDIGDELEYDDSDDGTLDDDESTDRSASDLDRFSDDDDGDAPRLVGARKPAWLD
tara:strand:+ start:468 stop:3962 length:3495 start_codon:yes stop_codon:yes gene_type:complete